MEICCRHNIGLELVKYLSAADQSGWTTQKNRHLIRQAGLYDEQVWSGLSNIIKESDSWVLFLAGILSGNTGGKTLSSSSTAAISCDHIQEMICVHLTLPGNPVSVVFLYRRFSSWRIRPRWTLRHTDKDKWTHTHTFVSVAGRKRLGQIAVGTETSWYLHLSLLAFFFSEDIDEQTLFKSPAAQWDSPTYCCWGTPKYKLYMNS